MSYKHSDYRCALLSVAMMVTMTWTTSDVSLFAQDAPAETPPAEDSKGTAVALNYCRAAFHRIRKHQTAEVFAEEQSKILNNLNLGRVNDPEVIALYTSVLDEITQIKLADRERDMHQRNHKSTVRRQVTWDALAFGTDLASAQFGSAVRTGANSWWDYRNKVHNRDMSLHQIDKTRVTTVVQRSSQFLDTFWKLARKRNIPDHWLVRGDDLDQLENAMSETDPAVRIRILKRMEYFMEAYPPYWYYVARTKQELGELTEAVDIYTQLEQLGDGHFRKDELLSTAMANQAAIQDYFGDEKAVITAQKALRYSGDVWEANLIAARVLQRHGQVADAEDAILRNLDVELEQAQSTVFLASLYYFSRDEKKLVSMLNNPKAVAHLPAPVLLRCAALVGVEQTPPVVVNNILASLEAYPKSSFGSSDQLVMRVGYAWQLHLAKLEVYQDGNKLSNPQVQPGNGFYDLRFAKQSERSNSLFNSSPSAKEVRMELTYPDKTVVKLTLNQGTATIQERTSANNNSAPYMRISTVSVDNQTLALRSREAMTEVPRKVTAEGGDASTIIDSIIPKRNEDAYEDITPSLSL